jgi:predicted permease
MRFVGLFKRARRDRELTEEIESHLQLHIDDQVRAGTPPAEARRQALRRFGPRESIKESYRDRRGVPALESLLRDLQLAARGLRHSAGFTLIVVLTLGLGIGAVTAVFSLAHGVVFRPLSYAEPDELVWLGHVAPGVGLDNDVGMAQGFYTAYRERAGTLVDVGIWRNRQRTLSDDADPEVVTVSEATSGFFTTLGVPPLLGRVLEPDDDRAVAGRSAVLSHELWRRRYGGDADVIGARVSLDGRPTTIVGVMPPDFATPGGATDVWLDASGYDFDRFGSFNDYAVGRVRAGVSLEDVRRDLDAAIDTVKETMPDAAAFIEDLRVAAVPTALKDRVVGSVERRLWVVLGSVAMVLAVACANVANLLLVRADARRRDAAVRQALGASRLQLARHALAESALLTLLGGLLGLGLAAVGVRALVHWAPVEVPRLDTVGIDPVVLLFVGGLTALLGAVLGVAPLLGRGEPAGGALREDGRATAGRARMRLRRAMLAGQVALALLLIVSAGLLARSFARLSAVDPGFDPDGLLTFELALPAARYETARDAADFHVALLERLEALPGVTSAAVTRRLPLRGLIGGNTLFEEGNPPAPGSMPPVVWLNRATEGYFETMRIPLRGGRTLQREDLEQRSNALVINEALAALYWPGQDPLGKRVTFYLLEEPVWSTIVGVVGNTKGETLEESPQPIAWTSPLGAHYDEAYGLAYALRTAVPPLSLADEVQRIVREADPGLAVVRLASARSIVDAARAPMAFTMTLLLLAAAVALALGAVGVYGVTAYAVRQRVAEIGVRMALGARGTDVRRRLLAESAVLALFGAVLGLAASAGFSRLTGALLYGVEPLDPVTHLAGIALLAAVVLVATWVPALAASRVDPASVLRR